MLLQFCNNFVTILLQFIFDLFYLYVVVLIYVDKNKTKNTKQKNVQNKKITKQNKKKIKNKKIQNKKYKTKKKNKKKAKNNTKPRKNSALFSFSIESRRIRNKVGDEI